MIMVDENGEYCMMINQGGCSDKNSECSYKVVEKCNVLTIQLVKDN